MVIGDADLWADTFPDYLIPRIIELVSDAWRDFTKPNGSDLEVPITRRFKHALREAKDFRKLPVRIERETVEDHLLTGDEIGRIDLKFMPAERARDQVYFAFECKRLNATSPRGTLETLAPEYVTQGMMRFMTGQYAATLLHGGMIGYVLDGRNAHAIGLVANNIRAHHVDLRMNPPGSLDRSSMCPGNDSARESSHNLRGDIPFLLHHLFLPVGDSAIPLN